MKIAHLILTHANPAQLGRLMRRLQHEDADFYIHIDLKTDIAPFLAIADKNNIHFIARREKVYWGGYSIVQATINGFEEILASGIAYDNVNLLSGQDYPVQRINNVHAYFESHPGKAFMHTLSVEKEWQEAIPRITQYHLANLNFKGRYKVEMIMNTIMPKRKFPMGMVPVGRSQWFTITLQQVAYIVDFLKKAPSFIRFFKLSWAPDEMIFQTILHNSPFQKDMVNDNLRYIDWSAGGASPKVLTMADAGKIDSSGKLFARKFNLDIDSSILDHLDKMAL